MKTVEPHTHNFSEEYWPFSVASNTSAFSSAKVVREDYPVLVVYHDDEGDWQFLHGDITDEDECLIICMGCAYDRIPNIAELASMPRGWRAERQSESSSWALSPYEHESDEA